MGRIHPHRAPGFENRKPEHRREDGGYPHVKLLFAERRECGKALARRIEREHAEAAEKRKAESRVFQMPDFRLGDPTAAYYAHMENIRRHLSIEDFSRVDAMIALRLPSNGHSRESVEETIRACAPTIRDKPTGRNWQRYAERTADYAFGPAGDRDLERNERYRELWRKIEEMEGEGTFKSEDEVGGKEKCHGGTENIVWNPWYGGGGSGVPSRISLKIALSWSAVLTKFPPY